jgi:hypothetical protein
MKEHLEESTTKFKDPEINESFTDNYIFFPISDKLVTPLRKLGLTPNGVTLLSFLFQLYTIPLLSLGKVEYACLSSFIGYILDCVDGNMARKYNMGSKYGMALDLVSDNISHFLIILFFVYHKGINLSLVLIIVLTYLLLSWNGIIDALTTHRTQQTDNFYNVKQKDFENEDYLLAKMYLNMYKTIYDNYKFLFPNYDEQKLNKWLKILKEFGPGNFMTLLIYILYINFKKE